MTLERGKQECHTAQYRSGNGLGGKQQFVFWGASRLLI